MKSSMLGALKARAGAFLGIAFALLLFSRADAGTPSAAGSDGANLPGASLLAPDVSSAFDRLAAALAHPVEPFVSSLDASEYSAPCDALSESRVVRGTLVSDLPVAPFPKRVYGFANAAWGTQEGDDSSSDAPGFSVYGWTGCAGQDWNLFQHSVWGYGLQGGQVTVSPKSGGTFNSRINSFSGNLHLSIFDALWRFDVLFGASRNWTRQRELSTGDTNRFRSSQQQIEAEFRARFDRGYTRVEPLVNLRIITLNEPASAENLLSTDRTSEFSDASYRLKVGSRFSWEHSAALATLHPYLQATWSHEFGKREIYVLGDGTSMPVAYRFGTHRMARDRLDLGGGVGAALRDTVDLYFQYDVLFAKDYAEYLFNAGINKKF